MSWSSVGTLGTAANTGNNQASIVLTTSATLEVGNVGVIIISVENNQTTDGDEGAVSGVVDSAGNTWSKAAEFTNGQGVAQTGAVCSIWYCQALTQLSSGGTITASFTNTASRDESCATAWEFSVTAGSTISVASTNTLADDGADPGSLDVTTSAVEHLRIRGTAGEINNITQWTKTAAFTANFDAARSANVATAMAVRGEYVISSSANVASDPTWASADHASVYVAFLETLATGSRFMRRLIDKHCARPTEIGRSGVGVF